MKKSFVSQRLSLCYCVPLANFIRPKEISPIKWDQNTIVFISRAGLIAAGLWGRPALEHPSVISKFKSTKRIVWPWSPPSWRPPFHFVEVVQNPMGLQSRKSTLSTGRLLNCNMHGNHMVILFLQMCIPIQQWWRWESVSFCHIPTDAEAGCSKPVFRVVSVCSTPSFRTRQHSHLQSGGSTNAGCSSLWWILAVCPAPSDPCWVSQPNKSAQCKYDGAQEWDQDAHISIHACTCVFWQYMMTNTDYYMYYTQMHVHI